MPLNLFDIYLQRIKLAWLIYLIKTNLEINKGLQLIAVIPDNFFLIK